MSKSKTAGKRRVRRSKSQIAFYALSFLLVISMAIGYVLIAALPEESETATPSPTHVLVASSTPAPEAAGVPVAPSPTSTPTPTPTP